jgi:hypothetical protein
MSGHYRADAAACVTSACCLLLMLQLTVNGCWLLPAQLISLPQRRDLSHQVLQHGVALLSSEVRPAAGAAYTEADNMGGQIVWAYTQAGFYAAHRLSSSILYHSSHVAINIVSAKEVVPLQAGVVAAERSDKLRCCY